VATYGDTPLFQGTVPAGSIESVPAFGTKMMPAATALYGDFSSVHIIEYPSGATLQVDPFSDFKSGQYGIRLTYFIDVMVAHPQSFYSITAIT
jgi:HK97 family phage major capsid protein